VNAAEKARLGSPNKTISDVFTEFIEENPQLRQNRDGFTLVNQGLIIMIAYGICVIPRERFDGFANFHYPLQSKELFIVIEDKKNVMGDRAEFLKKIRNAVAHVNINFLPDVPVDDPVGVELWNEDLKGDIDFRVTISVRGLLVFLNELGHQFADIYLRDHYPQSKSDFIGKNSSPTPAAPGLASLGGYAARFARNSSDL
jgi:hypothetical protein